MRMRDVRAAMSAPMRTGFGVISIASCPKWCSVYQVDQKPAWSAATANSRASSITWAYSPSRPGAPRLWNIENRIP